jgi:hypothetical protein
MTESPVTETNRMRISTKLFWLILPLFVGLVTPSAIILALETIVGRTSFQAAFWDIASRQFAKGENLFLLALIGLVPFILLSIFSFVAAWFLSQRRLACVSLGGLTGILGLMIPLHVSVWYPLYGGGQVYSTSAIAFLFIPFYCVVTLILGMVLGWAVSLLPSVRAPRRPGPTD